MNMISRKKKEVGMEDEGDAKQSEGVPLLEDLEVVDKLFFVEETIEKGLGKRCNFYLHL